MNTINNITQETLETIESYLDNSMSGAERELFEKTMASDLKLKQQVEDVKNLLQGIEAGALKYKLEDFHNEMESPVKKANKKTPKIISLKTISYIAAASVVLLFGIFMFMNNSTPSEKLFAKHFIPDPGLPTTMSSTDEYNFYDGLVDYKRKNYQTAIQKWENLLKQKPQNDTLNYFIGVAYLAEGNTQKSLFYLEQSQQFGESIFKEDAVFYQALAKVKEGNIEEAKKTLKTLPSEKNNRLLLDLND